MISNMKKFKDTVQKLGGIWSSENILFTQTRDYYEAFYMPTFTDDPHYREMTIEWNDTLNSLKITDKNRSGERRNLFYYADGKNRIIHPDLKKAVGSIQVLLDELFDNQQIFQIDENLLNIDREALGQVVFNETCSDTSGSFEEIGSDLLDVLYDCKTKEQYDLVNRTVAAVTGSRLERLVDMIKDLEIEQDL